MDKYDLHIQELIKYPECIREDWNNGIGLFAYASKSGESTNIICGCLTLIRRESNLFEVDGRPDLTKRIRADTGIPNDPSLITVESLPAFADWQRILDVELGRGD